MQRSAAKVDSLLAISTRDATWAYVKDACQCCVQRNCPLSDAVFPESRCATILTICIRRVDAAGCWIASVGCAHIVVVTRDRRVDAAGCWITSVGCAHIVVVTRDRCVDAACGRI